MKIEAVKSISSDSKLGFGLRDNGYPCPSEKDGRLIHESALIIESETLI